MPTFLYTAKDAQGQVITGRLEAADERAARARLAADGAQVQRIERIEPDKPAGQVGVEAASAALSTGNAAKLTDQVAALARAQLPLAPGLKALAGDLVSSRLKKDLLNLAGQLEAGVPLERALGEKPCRVAPHLRGAVLAGLRSGQLGNVLTELALHQRSNRDLHRSVWAALAYPLLVLGLLLLLLVAMLTWIVPIFADIYADFGIELPALTILVIEFSRLEWGWLILAGCLAVLALGAISICRPMVLPSRLLMSVPLIGPLWGWSALADFSRLLGTLVHHDVPLPEALRLTGDGMRHRGIGRACHALAGQVESGQALTEGFARFPFFPASLASLIQWGQQTGSLARSLLMAGDIYADRVEIQATFVKAVLPPIVFVIILVIVFLLICGLMIPLVDLIQHLT